MLRMVIVKALNFQIQADSDQLAEITNSEQQSLQESSNA